MNIVNGRSIAEVQQGLILQQVNCRGVMGSGVAKAIRDKWPKVFDEYKEKCFAKPPSSLLGTMIPVQVEDGLFVLNLFGQLNYGRELGHRYTSYDALDEALKTTSSWMKKHEFSDLDVHHPLIGSGLGGGNWPIVKALIEQHIGYDTTLWVSS